MARNMASLLTPGEAGDCRFEPFETSSAGIAALVVLLGGAAVAMLFTPHVLPRVLVVVLAAILVNNLVFVGSTYLLTKRELVVYRFGTERLRLPLADVQRTGALVHLPYVVFTGRRVWLPGSAVTQFLTELNLRAVHLGSASLAPQPVGEAGVRLSLLQLALPSECVVCGQLAATAVPAPRAWHLHFVPTLDVRAPVCGPHRSRLTWERRLWNLTVFLVAGVIAAGLIFALADPRSPFGVAIVAASIGLVVMAVVGRLGLGDWSDERVLGLRLTDMSADHQTLVLRIRDAALRDEVVRLTDERVRACLGAVAALPDSPR